MAPTYGCFTRGKVPLRDAGADLDVVVLATSVCVLVLWWGKYARSVRTA